MFDGDFDKAKYEKEYIIECISKYYFIWEWIERRLSDVEQKTKKNQEVIDNKSSFPGERSRETIDRLMAIDEEMEGLMQKVEDYGVKGMIDESAQCLEEIDRLKDRRREI